jgi:membrane protease YdiL (CAAX protease family)
MQPIGSKEILLIFLLLFVVYLVAAMFAAEGWVLYRLLRGQRVLPESPMVARRPVPWGLWTVLLTIVLYFAVNIGAFVAYAKLTGRLPARLVRPPAPPAAAPDESHPTPDLSPLAEAKPASPELEPTKVKPKPESKPEGQGAKDLPVADTGGKATAPDLGISLTEGLAIQAVINVILLILLPFILRMTSRSPLQDLGLCFRGWWRQAAVGVIAFLAIQPVIFVIQLAMTSVWKNNAHPLYKMILDEFSPGVPQLAILMAVVIAPIFEEFMFRGIIQSWLVSVGTRRRREPTPVLVECAVIPLTEDVDPASPWELDPAPLTTKSGATAEATTLPPQPITTPIESSSRQRSGLAGIIATSLVFAGMHGPQWPAPIALFVLSVVIGYVYHRTGSLIVAICMHATFNGFSTLLLLGFLLVPQSAREPKKAALSPIPVVSKIIVQAADAEESLTSPNRKRGNDLTPSVTLRLSVRRGHGQ